MCSQSRNHEGHYDSNEEDHHEFAELLKRWGIKFPEETTESLGIDTLIEKWCDDKFERPLVAMKELRESQKHVEASAALFGYCYVVLARSFFGLTLEQCLKYHLEQIECERMRETSGRDQETTQILLEYHQHNAILCRDLISFAGDNASGQFLYPEGQGNSALSSYVDVLLTAARALVVFSGVNKEYDPYLSGDLERIFDIIKQSKVQQAQRFSTLNFNDTGKNLSGDVEGFLACLGCAVVCYSLAQMKSELRPDCERDYETAFKAYVQGAKYMLRTDYQIGFFNELFTSESEESKDALDIYWKIIEAWEELKRNTGIVQNWQELSACLMDLEDIMYREDHDTDIGLYPTDEPGFVYLPRQISFCDARLSQQDIYQLIEQQKKGQHKQRLLNDYFEGLWWNFEVDTRKRIISAEYEWYDGPDRGSYVKSAIEHYSVALEIELRVIVFRIDEVRHCVQGIIDKQRNDRAYRKYMKLASKNAESLTLKDISKLLKYSMQNREDVEPIGEAISALPIKENDRLFFRQRQFIADLYDIYQLRIDSTHTLQNPDMLSCIHDLRKRILGIGCEGYLMKLALMKKHIYASKQDKQ